MSLIPLTKSLNWESLIERDPSTPDGDVYIPRFLKTVWEMRGDLQRIYPLDTLNGRVGFVGWWTVWGVADYPNLDDAFNQFNIVYLKAAAFPQDDGPLIDRFMKSVFDSRAGVQESFPSILTTDRLRFIAWFYFGFMVAEGAMHWLDSRVIQLLGSPRDEDSIGTKLASIFLAEAGLAETEPRLFFETWLNRATSTGEAVKAENPSSRSPELIAGVNIIGHATGQLGVGEDVRMMVRGLSAADINHSAYQFPLTSMAPNRDRTISQLIKSSNSHKVNMFCLPGFDCIYAAGVLGKSFFSDHYNVGFCQWELPRWPEPLSLVFSIMDEMWASTRFTQQSMLTVAKIPVRHVPMVVELPKFSRKSRKEFGLPDQKLIFMFTFDFISSVYRKNPGAVIEAFLAAFPAESGLDVSLVIKSGNRDRSNPDVQKVEQLCRADSRIIWIHETMDRADFLALMNCCDVFVSLHRSEGFGRNLAEAMLMEKIVVATDWSGNVDFCNQSNSLPVKYELRPVLAHEYSFSKNQTWAEPDVDHAAEQLKKAFLMSVGTRAEIGATAKRTIENQYSAPVVGRIYSDLLKGKV